MMLHWKRLYRKELKRVSGSASNRCNWRLLAYLEPKYILPDIITNRTVYKHDYRATTEAAEAHFSTQKSSFTHRFQVHVAQTFDLWTFQLKMCAPIQTLYSKMSLCGSRSHPMWSCPLPKRTRVFFYFLITKLTKDDY